MRDSCSESFEVAGRNRDRLRKTTVSNDATIQFYDHVCRRIEVAEIFRTFDNADQSIGKAFEEKSVVLGCSATGVIQQVEGFTCSSQCVFHDRVVISRENPKWGCLPPPGSPHETRQRGEELMNRTRAWTAR